MTLYVYANITSSIDERYSTPRFAKSTDSCHLHIFSETSKPAQCRCNAK